MFPQTHTQTYIHTHSCYVCMFRHTYIHTYIPRWGGRQGLPARYLLTSANEVCRKHTDLENDRYVCMSGETIAYLEFLGMYVSPDIHTYL